MFASFGRSLGTARRARARFAIGRAEVAVVFQSDNLWPSLSAQENVAIAAPARGGTRRRRRGPSRRSQRFGLEGRRRQRAGTLSGGEQQRVAIAAAAARRAPLVLADEPTGELDAAQRRHRPRRAQRLRDEYGSTVVIVTHSTRRRRRGRPRGRDPRRAGAVSPMRALRNDRAASEPAAGRECGRSLSAAVASVSAYGRGSAAWTRSSRSISRSRRARAVRFWGRSGSGKTTLLHVLGGLVEPSCR